MRPIKLKRKIEKKNKEIINVPIYGFNFYEGGKKNGPIYRDVQINLIEKTIKIDTLVFKLSDYLKVREKYFNKHLREIYKNKKTDGYRIGEEIGIGFGHDFVGEIGTIKMIYSTTEFEVDIFNIGPTVFINKKNILPTELVKNGVF